MDNTKVNSNKFSKIGFGTYRIAKNNKRHTKALIYALKSGCQFIDTATIYNNGQAEEIIGKVLMVNPQYTPLIVSKAGYVQGDILKTLAQLNEKGIATTGITEINENFKHSINPDFIEEQLNSSLDRLKRSKIDSYLLHNPEVALKRQGITKETYYAEIKLAFAKLEELVSLGLINNYGISSNSFALDARDPSYTSIHELIKIAKEINADNHFKVIQFPLNLIELAAISPVDKMQNIIQIAKDHSMTVISNRPFNALSKSGLLRLSDSKLSIKDFSQQKVDDSFTNAMKALKTKWIEVEPSENIDEFPALNQIKKTWSTLNTPDAVEQLFYQNIFPLIATIFGRNLSSDESQPFYSWFEQAILKSKKNMLERTLQFKAQALESGLLEKSDLALTHQALNYYFNHGVDYVLVGMRHTDYVDDMIAWGKTPE